MVQELGTSSDFLLKRDGAIVRPNGERKSSDDSYWSQQLREAIASESNPSDAPCIEVRPVVFRGTYDEWNWSVLQNRWDDLRAQLHGVIIPASLHDGDAESMALVKQLEECAPNFSPSREFQENRTANTRQRTKR